MQKILSVVRLPSDECAVVIGSNLLICRKPGNRWNVWLFL